MPNVQHIEVTLAEGEQKLENLLRRRLGPFPRSMYMKWCRSGQLRLDGKRVKPFARVQVGQVVRVPPFTPQGEGTGELSQPETTVNDAEEYAESDATLELPVVFEDADLLVVNKPCGLPVHPGSNWTDAVTTRLEAVYGDAPFMPTPAHRLDKDTSGLLAVAKSYVMLRTLHAAFKPNAHEAVRARKVYHAVVLGHWQGGEPMELTDCLAKGGKPGAERVEACPIANTADGDCGHEAETYGKHAVSVVRPLAHFHNAAYGPLTLLEITLRTGRTHQIRVQLSSRGYPLLGDRKYGGPAASRLHLHAHGLHVAGYSLEHPAEDFVQG